MKTSFVLFVLLLCAGCTLIPSQRNAPSGTSPQAEHLFLQGLDELTTTGVSPSFATLHHQYPHSPWTVRATQISTLCTKPAARLNQLKGELQQCSRDKTRLNEQIKQLRDDLDKLKQLLIEMEMRAN